MSLAKSLGVALVTGAAQGIGKTIAIRLASDGFRVALNDLPSKRELLHAVAQDIDRKYGLGSFVAPADVSQEVQVKEMVESSSKALGGLNVVGPSLNNCICRTLICRIVDGCKCRNIRGLHTDHRDVCVLFLVM